VAADDDGSGGGGGGGVCVALRCVVWCGVVLGWVEIEFFMGPCVVIGGGGSDGVIFGREGGDHF